MKTLLAVVVALGACAFTAWGCGGGSKPPMQPDNDTTADDAGAAAPAPSAAPAPGVH